MVKKMEDKLISSQWLINDLLNKSFYPAIVKSSIESAPAVDAEPIRHGYWYFLQYDVNPKIGNWHCSVCNNIPKSLEKENYCPNCGAKMDGDWNV